MTNTNYTNLALARKRYETMVHFTNCGKTFNFRAWAGIAQRMEKISRLAITQGQKQAMMDRCEDAHQRARKALRDAL